MNLAKPITKSSSKSQSLGSVISAAGKLPLNSQTKTGNVSLDKPTPFIRPWLNIQTINVSRHASALRPFTRQEFGTHAAAPNEAHIHAVNQLLIGLRQQLLKRAKLVKQVSKSAQQDLSTDNLQRLVTLKEQAHNWVQAVEKVWDYYFELFGQRQSRVANWLLSCDRIAQDCYQVMYRGLGTSRSVPTPAPFTYMRTGFSPATFRRLIPLQRLGLQLNPFPLIEIPYHRLMNPWTLSAVCHETSHNLQNDCGLAKAIPNAISHSLLKSGLDKAIIDTWVRWNREIFADLCALLLGGPAVVASLMDVVGRSPRATLTYIPDGPHPTSYLRILISTSLLSRMGFEQQAVQYQSAWKRIYPNPSAGNIPPRLLATFPKALPIVIQAVCYDPYAELGNRSLAQVMNFEQKDQAMIVEAAHRLAAGIDPGIIPERFLIGAARVALDQGLARPGKIAENFYHDLSRR